MSSDGGLLRGRKMERIPAKPRSRSLSVCLRSRHEIPGGGLLSTEDSSADVFIISRLGDTTSYFFSWFCKKNRLSVARDLRSKEEVQSRCPICLDACPKSIIELRCGHSFCRSCLTRSAANKMTFCALCRREQEINPELLRARFEEQRMRNLAQRLAIRPPARSRPSTAAASLMAIEGERVRKEGLGLAGSPTSAREMLFGPWGDVGAMSADDLRRRWKFSSVPRSTAPGAETVGAVPAFEIRASWLELQHASRSSTFMYGERECSGIPLQASFGSAVKAETLSCVGEPGCVSYGIGGGAMLASNAGPDSPCVGGCSGTELGFRWRNLTRTALYSNTAAAQDLSTEEPMSDCGALSEASLGSRWREANGRGGVGHLTVGDLSNMLEVATGLEGVGAIVCTIVNPWLGVNAPQESVDGGNTVGVMKTSHEEPVGVGAASTTTLRTRWWAAGCRSAPVG